MSDEPGIPANGAYAHEHTLARSRKIARAHAVILVTPPYNWGYPAPLKNAIDHLYKEWTGKPVMIVIYGSHGGGKCAAQLRQVAEGLKMRPVPIMPGITRNPEMIMGGAVDPERDFQGHAETLATALAQFALELKSAASQVSPEAAHGFEPVRCGG